MKQKTKFTNERNLQLVAHELSRQIFVANDPTVLVGAGIDDAAVIASKGKKLIVSADFVNSKRISDTYGKRDLEDLGTHIVRQNITDILCTGGIPRWFVFSAVLDSECTKEDIEVLFRAVQNECARHNITVIGGDTKEGPSIVVHGTILGELADTAWGKCVEPLETDIYVSGELSGVTAALCLLEYSDSTELRKRAFQTLSEADIPVETVANIRALGLPIAATDISDGLGYSLCEFVRSTNNMKITIDLNRVPLHPLTKLAAESLGIPLSAFCFAFGGDFQIVFAAPKENRNLFKGTGAVRIGQAVPGHGESQFYRGEMFGKLPDFGHLDFEHKRPVERFIEHATHFERFA